MKLTTPYADVLLPLSAEEFAALRDSIKAEGVRDPVLHTEDGRVLDGHHRLKIKPDAPRHVIPNSASWSDAECQAYVIRSNWQRRNLSPSQKAELREKMKRIAFALREQDKKRFTQPVLARTFGISREAVSKWFVRSAKAGSNGTYTNNTLPVRSEKPDARVKLSPQQKAAVAEQVASGRSRAAVAADFQVGRRTVDNVVKAAEKKAAVEAERARKAAEAKAAIEDEDRFVLHGDFRETLAHLADGSVSLIFTDPPYDRDSIPLYGDLAALAKRLLVDGGSLLCYVGHYAIPEVLPIMTGHLEYLWCCAVVHTGERARMNYFGIRVGWKPLLWLTKGSRNEADRQRFIDDVVISGGRDKEDHDWQQSEVEAVHFIEGLTRPGELVVDPFAGSGTTLAAAVRLKRQALGSEKNDSQVALANRKVTDAYRIALGGDA